TSYGGLLAGDVDGSTPPPAGEDETLVALGGTATSLAVWRFHVDWADPANSALTGPTPLTVAPYTIACGGIGPCVAQAGTAQLLDAVSDRLMYRLAYRDFGDHESLVATHNVNAGSDQAGERWYELRNIATSPTVYQQGTYAPDSAFRWMGSAAQDKAGDLVLGYSLSSGASFPAIRITGRAGSDPPGTMTRPEATLFTGSGSQTTYSRWGDYTSMSIDPADDCTFWYTDEYLPSTGSFNWQTRLAAFQMPGCLTPTFSIGTQPAARTVSAGGAVATTVSATAIGGDTETVALTATGLPAGTTASFQPSSIGVGGTATLTLSTSSTTPVGTYQVTVSGTGSSGTHGTTFILTVAAVTCTTPNVPLYQPDVLGQLRRWSYAAPLDGTSGWTQQAIGIGWLGLTIVSGGDGVLYTIDGLGNLHWYQDDGFAGTGGAAWSAGTGSIIGTGWGGFATVVAGGQGVIYAIDSAGNLRWYRYLGTNGSSSWAPGSGSIIGTGWSFARVVAGGSGVLYGVKSSGALLWYRELSPLTGSASWAAAGTGGQIGSGWSGFSRIGSMGGGVLFARDTGGTLWWYRHADPLGGSASWANQGAGTGEGGGWSGSQIATDVTGCVAS
ncbi:MAG: tachylectin-related carbohydrate-binding protein, partial [Catenulispora sp.]